MNNTTLLILTLALSSCATGGGGPSSGVKPPPINPPATIYLTGEPQWKTMADVKKAVGSKATVTGTKVDLGGNALSGKNIKHPSNSQDEKSIPLRVSINGFYMRNGIVRDIPGGIVVSGRDTMFEKLTFVEIGEDALTSRELKASGMHVEDCKFYNDGGGDKSLQMNEVDGAHVRGNYITGGQTGMRLGESSRKGTMSMVLVDNKFEKVPTAINADGDTRIRTRGNTFMEVLKDWVKGSRVRVTDK